MKSKDEEQPHTDTLYIDKLETLIIDACMDAGNYVKDNAFNITGLNWKKTDDPVTDLDKTAERMIREHIGSKIEANFYGEEYGVDNKNLPTSIYIDPIDGTKSFIRGEYLSSVSIAAEHNGKMIVGAVYDFMRGILYYADQRGAFMRNHNKKELKLPAMNVGLSKITASFSDDNEPYKGTLLKEIEDKMYTRKTIGSTALSMAQLAAGSYDVMIAGPHSKNGITDICDIAAGYYIMKQAGMEIRDYDFEEYDYKRPNNGIIAWNKKAAVIGEIFGRAKMFEKMYNQEKEDIDRMCRKYGLNTEG